MTTNRDTYVRRVLALYSTKPARVRGAYEACYGTMGDYRDRHEDYVFPSDLTPEAIIATWAERDYDEGEEAAVFPELWPHDTTKETEA